jgi:hypothetical protein
MKKVKCQAALLKEVNLHLLRKNKQAKPVNNKQTNRQTHKQTNLHTHTKAGQ